MLLRLFLGCVLLLVGGTGDVFAQAARIEPVSVRQGGLSSDRVHCLLQDRFGFVWIGTADGLNRYDGYSSTVYKHTPGDPNSIAGNTITVLYEDRSGSLWIGLSNGLARYVRETEQFVSYQHDPNDSTSISFGAVSSVYEDDNGQFWVASANGGLQVLDQQSGTFRRYIPDPKYKTETLFTSAIHPDVTRPNRFWIALATFQGGWELFSFHTVEKTFEPCAVGTVPFRGYVWNIFDDPDGILWFVASNGLHPFDPKSKTFLALDGLPEAFKKMNKTWLFSANLGPDGKFWIGTGKEGVCSVDKRTGQTVRYDADFASSGTAGKNKAIKAILHDRSGIVWIGSLTGGLYRIAPGERPFRLVLPDTSKAPVSLTTNSVTAFLEDRSGRTWVGMDDTGVHLFDAATGRLQQAVEVFPELDIQRTFSIYSLCETPDGRIWIGTNSQGLVCFDPTRRTATHYRNNPEDSTSLAADYVQALLVDRHGDLWIGTYLGLDRFNPRTGRFEHYRYAATSPAGEYSNYITSLYEDRNGNLWAGTQNGVALLHRSTKQFSYFLRQDEGGASYLAVFALAQDSAGAIWAGTVSGLYRLVFSDPAKPGTDQPVVVRRYSEADGLANQRIFGLLTDAQNRLWLSTPSGVSEFRNPGHDAHTTPDFKNYDARDGLQTDMFTQGAALKGRSGRYYFGGLNGFNIFLPDSIRPRDYRPPLVITAFEKFDTDRPDTGAVPERGIAVREEVVLSHKNNIFSIEFAALDFHDPNKCRYAYRMRGFNDSWVQLGTQRRVTFTNLNPGTYTFEVRGTNSDGVWNETTTSLKIVITPPWWKTVWAYMTYALLFVVAVAGFVRARGRYLENRNRELEQAVTRSTAQILEQKEILEKQAQELQELDRLKSRFYANITHELRTPLTLMLGPLNSVLKNWRADPTHRNLLQIAQDNGRKLLHLISEILDLGKLDANRMVLEEKPVTVRPLLARLAAQFDSHAGYLGISLTCHCDLPPDELVLLDAKKFETVVNNLLSNALKFTPPGGSVAVSLTKQNERLLLSVQDTGRGIHPEDLPHVFDRYFQTKRPDTPVEGGTGIGLALSAELVRLMHGRIWVESRVGEGSAFWVEWPTVPAWDSGVINEDIFRTTDHPVLRDVVPTVPVWDSGVIKEGISLTTNHPVLRDVAPLPSGGGAGGGAEPAVKILIVEDNPDLQAYLLHLLAPEYDVAVVANGAEALAWLNPTPIPSPGGEGCLPSVPVGDFGAGNQNFSPTTNQPVLRDVAPLPPGGGVGGGVDLIISDIMMPRMDGFQLLEALKNDDRYRHIPVVMLTARADMQDKLQALRIGVDDYLTKPFDEEELLARVRNLVQRRKNRMEAITETEAPSPRIAQADAEWLAELETWTRANLQNEFLSVSAMAHQAALSERQLLRRMRELTGLSPQQYIGEIRLQKARELLELGTFHTVAEAAYTAGFGNTKAFSRAYRERFGRLPSSYF